MKKNMMSKKYKKNLAHYDFIRGIVESESAKKWAENHGDDSRIPGLTGPATMNELKALLADLYERI